MLNDSSQSVDCAYYEAAFKFLAGEVTDSLSSPLTLTITGDVTVPAGDEGIEVDPTDKVTLVDVLPDVLM